jgi:hypothetical protein
MNMNKILATATLAAAGALGVGAAQAREVDVQWSVTLGSPFYAQPAPVYAPPGPVYWQPVAGYSQRGYHQPTRWDRDGDGIPNRYDRLYNPRWDRDGDGIPNRFDRHDGRGGHDDRGGHDGRDGRGR